MIFRLRYRERDYELLPGNFVVGRSPECHLCLDDRLVSRRHAVFLIDRDRVIVEDLGSRNGLRVNERPIEGRRTLELGDTISILGHDLQLCGTPGPDATTANHLVPSRPSDAFAMLSELADKALALGRGEEAERLLSINLLSVLENLEAGRDVPREVTEQAAHYAARLARATHHGRWFDYALRWQAKLKTPCSNETLDELYAAAKAVDEVDVKGVANCVGTLVNEADNMGPAERFLLARMQGLEKLCRLRH
jgi:hypothetical protein